MREASPSLRAEVPSPQHPQCSQGASAPSRSTHCTAWHGAPMGCTVQRLLYLFIPLPSVPAHTGSGAASPCPGWGCQVHLGDPKLHASTVPTLLSSWVPASASHCCQMPILCGEVLAPWYCVCRTCLCRVAPSCASGHLIFPHSSSKSISSKSGEWLCKGWELQGTGCAQWALLHILKEPVPPPAPCAVNLLLQMANFENPLIRIRSSTSIFIYFPFS